MSVFAAIWAFLVSIFSFNRPTPASIPLPTLPPQPTIVISQSTPTPYTPKPTIKVTPRPTIKPTIKPTSTSTPQNNTSSSSNNNGVTTNPTSIPPTSVPVATTTPASQMGFTFSTDSIDITVRNDWSLVNVFTFTSTGSTGYSFSGTPQYNGMINWTLASGGIGAGQTNQEQIQIYQTVPPGVYEGTMVFKDTTTQATKNFPTKITVTN